MEWFKGWTGVVPALALRQMQYSMFRRKPGRAHDVVLAWTMLPPLPPPPGAEAPSHFWLSFAIDSRSHLIYAGSGQDVVGGDISSLLRASTRSCRARFSATSRS